MEDEHREREEEDDAGKGEGSVYVPGIKAWNIQAGVGGGELRSRVIGGGGDVYRHVQTVEAWREAERQRWRNIIESSPN